MKTILVTGAAGRIGSLLCAALSKKGYSVRAFVQKKNSVSGKNVTEFEGDILDVQSINAAAKGVDAIVHLAAIIDSSAPKNVLFDVNVQGTKNVLAAAPNGCKFIYASSVSVYGRSLPPIANENTPAKPSTPYGTSKYFAEAAVLCAAERLQVASLQFGVVYGKGFEEGYFAVFKRLQKGKMKIIGDGRNTIPFVHVQDVVDAILRALEKKTPSQIYLIVGEQKTQKELFEMAAKELGVAPPTSHLDKNTACTLAKMNDFFSRIVGKKSSLNFDAIEMVSSHRAFDTGRAEKELGWKAKVKLSDGVREMVKEYLKKRG